MPSKEHSASRHQEDEYERPDDDDPRPEGDAHTRDSEARDERDDTDTSLFEMATAVVVVLRQVWSDRLALFRAEGKLAVKTLTLVVLVLFCMALAVTLIWVSLLVVLSMVALEAGVHWVGVAAGVIVAQLLMLWYLKRQLDQLLDWMSFPETRRSFARVPEPQSLTPKKTGTGAAAESSSSKSSSSQEEPNP